MQGKGDACTRHTTSCPDLEPIVEGVGSWSFFSFYYLFHPPLPICRTTHASAEMALPSTIRIASHSQPVNGPGVQPRHARRVPFAPLFSVPSLNKPSRFWPFPRGASESVVILSIQRAMSKSETYDSSWSESVFPLCVTPVDRGPRRHMPVESGNAAPPLLYCPLPLFHFY